MVVQGMLQIGMTDALRAKTWPENTPLPRITIKKINHYFQGAPIATLKQKLA